ncbi:MAG: DUF485 domain-containing protein [Sulfuricaulis sp.]
MTTKNKLQAVRELPEFHALVAQRWAVSLGLTAAMLCAYFGYILVLAFDKSVLAAKIGDHLTIGIPIGVGVIVFAWVLTGIYVWWANRYYDKTVKQIRDRMGV